MGHGLNGLRRPEPLAADDKDGFFFVRRGPSNVKGINNQSVLKQKKSV